MKKSMFILIAVLALLFGIWANIATKSDFTTLDSQKNSWSSLQGKWVVINYFAEWCVPCLREIPELNKFHQQHNPNILLYGVSFDKVTRAQLSALKSTHRIQFPLIENLQLLPWGNPPTSLPTTFIIGPDGKVKKQLKGEQSAEKLLAVIYSLQGL